MKSWPTRALRVLGAAITSQPTGPTRRATSAPGEGQHVKMTTKVTAAAVAAALGALSGCAASEPEAGDPALFFDRVATSREAHVAIQNEPAHLADALPQEQTGRSWSALALEGTVVSVEPQHGVHYPNADPGHRGNEEAGAEIVAFDDPRAHERVLTLTVEPEWSTGADEDVVITLGASGDIDPEKFVSSLRGLDDVVAVLGQRVGGRTAGEYHPILNGALLGRVDSAGTIHFDGLGAEEKEFVDGIDTVKEFREAAGA